MSKTPTITTADGSRIWHDPEHYEELCTPFLSIDDANAAMEAFANEVRALRDKFRLRDVVVCVEVTIAHKGRYASCGGMQSMGDNSRVVPMLQRGVVQMTRTIENAVPPWTDGDDSVTDEVPE